MSKDLWGRLAGSYNVDHTYISGADLVSAIQSELVAAVPVGTVVELGCGTGLYTRAYAPKCREVIGIDLSDEMVGAARQSLTDLPNVSVVVADATRTGLASATADAVIAVNLLHIVPDGRGPGGGASDTPAWRRAHRR